MQIRNIFLVSTFVLFTYAISSFAYAETEDLISNGDLNQEEFLIEKHRKNDCSPLFVRRGPTGPTGANGANGATGDRGPTGAQGAGIFTSGIFISGIPTNNPAVAGTALLFPNSVNNFPVDYAYDPTTGRLTLKNPGTFLISYSLSVANAFSATTTPLAAVAIVSNFGSTTRIVQGCSSRAPVVNVQGIPTTPIISVLAGQAVISAFAGTVITINSNATASNDPLTIFNDPSNIPGFSVVKFQ